MNAEMAPKLCTVEADLLTWMAVHGNLLLALRHPQNCGPAGQLVADFAKKLGEMLVEGGIITQAELDYTHQVESKGHSMTEQASSGKLL